MAEMRRDELHDTWVIVAPERGPRPRDTRLETVATGDATCPFCPGNETETPPEIVATGRPPGQPSNIPPWRVRVVPNRYPAVTPPLGRHEVVISTPDHARDLAAMRPAHVAELLTVVRDRYRALAGNHTLRSILFFVNAGAGAGASLAHPHGQILATVEVPAVLTRETVAMAAWRADHASCLICDEIAAADPRDLLVAAGLHGALYVPVASRFSWEMRLAPRVHTVHFGLTEEAVLEELGALLVCACRALRDVAGDVPYNLVLHTAPQGVDEFHWHLELLPRLSPLAGFEVGTGFYINAVSPPRAAAELRAIVGSGATGWSA